MTTILVLRLSSMGDVLLTLPVMKGILSRHRDLNIVFVTRNKFIPYFAGISRLTAVAFDPEGRHKGFSGLFSLYGELRQYQVKQVIDLHGVIRTYFLDLLFFISGCRIYRISKYRKMRRMVLRRRIAGLSVPPTTTRYLDVFARAGYRGTLSDLALKHMFPTDIRTEIKTGTIRIGMAPISKHATKNWGLKNFAELIRLLSVKFEPEVHLFGGQEDHSVLDSLAAPGVLNHSGMLTPMNEIALIRTLDIFISMDSANMHLASLAGIPTISIWGATDPHLGFAPADQPDDYSLFADPMEVTCRPCSVFGEIPCRRSDSPMICMLSIKPEMVIRKIEEILQSACRN